MGNNKLITQPIRGCGGGGKGGGGSAHESDDTLFSTAYIEIIEVISEGRCKGLVNGKKSIFFDDTPVMSVDGTVNHRVEFDYALGTQYQRDFRMVDSVSSESTIGLLVSKGTPIIREISNPDADDAVVTIGIPTMISIDDKGNTNGSSVDFKIELQPFGEAYYQVNKVSVLTKGYFIDGSHFMSPSNTHYMDCYIETDTPDDVVIEGSPNGLTDWVVMSIVQVVKRGDLYVASERLEVSPGKYYLRWNYVNKIGALTGRMGLLASNGNHIDYYSYVESNVITIKGKTKSKYQKQFKFPLTGSAPWLVKVTRVSDNSTSSHEENGIYWDSLRTETVLRLNYPNTALMYYKISSNEFTSVPKISTEWRMKEVDIPNNYDPDTRTYTGIWDGGFVKKWSDNPAWCFYDLCTSERYGIGKYLKLGGSFTINKWVMYQIAQYCDEMVDSGRRDNLGAVIYEPRFTMNIHIVDARQAYDWLNDMVSVFRGMMYVINGLVSCTADMPSDSVAMFNQTNVIDGQFTFSGTGALARKTVALVTWRDPDDLYNEKQEYVPASKEMIKRYGVNIKEIVAIGCTSRGQAHRLGKWSLLDGEVVTFKASFDSSFVKPGDVISCMIPMRNSKKRVGGRVSSINGNIVTLDSEVEFVVGHRYHINIMTMDGTIEAKNLIVTGNITTNIAVMESALSNSVSYNAIWALIDLDGIMPSKWKILTIKEVDQIVREITAITYDPNKYATIDTFNSDITSSIRHSSYPLSMSAVTDVTITNIPFTDKNGMAQNKLHVHWSQVKNAIFYSVRWRLNFGNWSAPHVTQSQLTELIIKGDGTYYFEVTAIGEMGKVSPVTIASQVITGDGSPINLLTQWVDY